jgi:hypothetical protein
VILKASGDSRVVRGHYVIALDAGPEETGSLAAGALAVTGALDGGGALVVIGVLGGGGALVVTGALLGGGGGGGALLVTGAAVPVEPVFGAGEDGGNEDEGDEDEGDKDEGADDDGGALDVLDGGEDRGDGVVAGGAVGPPEVPGPEEVPSAVLRVTYCPNRSRVPAGGSETVTLASSAGRFFPA